MSRRAFPPLNHLRAFEAAARHLSFTMAASELNMTQSAVSQQIKSLEGYLGQPLFYRRPKGLELTAMGKNYLPTVRDAFQTLGRGTRMLMDGSLRATLSVQCNLTFSVYWLAPRLQRFYARHPEVRLNITTAIWEPMGPVEEADVEIRFLSRSDPPDGFDRLTWDSFYPVCAPGYDVSLQDVAQHRLFYCTAMLTTWQSWAEAAGYTGPAPQVSHSQVLAMALSAAENGAGLAMAHDCVARHAIETGRLVRPFEAVAEMTESYCIGVNPAAQNRADAQAFASWIKEEMAAEYPGLTAVGA